MIRRVLTDAAYHILIAGVAELGIGVVKDVSKIRKALVTITFSVLEVGKLFFEIFSTAHIVETAIILVIAIPSVSTASLQQKRQKFNSSLLLCMFCNYLKSHLDSTDLLFGCNKTQVKQ